MVDFNKGSNFVVAREDTGYFFFIKKKIHLLFSRVKGTYVQLTGDTSVLCFASFVFLWKYYTEGELLKQQLKNQLIFSIKY